MPDRIVATVFLLAAFAFAMHGCAKSRQDEAVRQLLGRVRTEFLHAWSNYERYAWGQDALRPLSKTGHDWYGQSLLMTPVDALPFRRSRPSASPAGFIVQNVEPARHRAGNARLQNDARGRRKLSPAPRDH